MKRLLLALLLTVGAFAQTNTLSLSCPTTSAPEGATIQVSLNYNGAAVAGLEWNFAGPNGSTVTFAPGPAATLSAKTLSCNSAGTLCLEAGLNSNTISPGVVAIYSVRLPTIPGTYSISLPNTPAPALGASPAGTAVAVAVGSPLGVVVLSRYDLNGDGLVNQLDVNLAAQQALGLSPCTNADVNGDGACNLLDVQLIVAASLGVIPQ